ncbi:MAG: cytochrome c-type biogenesis protein CcmH [Spirochaetia bacterium]|nr:cytochrome c-type biogenesis protein CcmH [Spirochaetia bacterium]
MINKKKSVLILFISAITIFSIHLFAQSAHSSLKDTALLKRFKYISERLMCQCGCKLPLDTCNMSDCIAWPMRSAIEKFLQAGKSDEYIINGFINGFHDIVDTDPAFAHARATGSHDVFREGIGEEGYTEPQSKSHELLIYLAGLLFTGVAGLFIRNHFKKINKETVKSDKNTEKLTGKEEEYFKKLYDEE